VWDKQSEQARHYELLVTENMDGEDRKYSGPSLFCVGNC
jgi:hypothetical protein